MVNALTTLHFKKGGCVILEPGVQLILLHSERPKLYGILIILSAIGLISATVKILVINSIKVNKYSLR